MAPTRKPAYRRFDAPALSSNGTTFGSAGRGLVDNSSTQPTTPAGKPYDDTGAMQFIVCTIIVYSVGGVGCIFVSRFRRYTRSNSDFKQQDEAVNKYLKKEKHLKLEGYKMQMMKEIDKHSENIKRYEERMRLLELERALQNEDFSTLALCSRTNKSKRKGFLKRNKKKQNLMNKSNMGVLPSRLMNRRRSASDALVGASLLFMNPSNPRLQELQEEEEDVASTLASTPECATPELSRSNIEIVADIPLVELEVKGQAENGVADEQTNAMDKNLLAVEETTLSSSV